MMRDHVSAQPTLPDSPAIGEAERRARSRRHQGTLDVAGAGASAAAAGFATHARPVASALARVARWASARAHLVLGGALTAWLGFHAGGFFPGSVGVAAAAVAIVALLRLTGAPQPVAGWNLAVGAIALAGAGLASWTLLSAQWSDAAGRVLPEFDRTLLYLLAFCTLAAVPRREGDLSAMLRWVLLAIVAIAVVGLTTRLSPGTLVVEPGRAGARLAYPLTYWNAESVLFALGVVLALHLASGEQEPIAVRVLAGAALPVLVVAGYFPFSRGGVATAVIGIVAYAVLARPRRLVATLATAGPAVAATVATAYDADALATVGFAHGHGPSQGHHVAVVLALCVAGAALARLAILPLERRLDGWRPTPALRRRALLAAAAAAALALAVGAVAIDAPARARAQYHAFVRGNVVQESGDLRSRLASSGNNGRIALWRVSLKTFGDHPAHGSGAGTFDLSWERRRPAGSFTARDGHSLYLETLAELGVVGGALLLVFLGALVVGPARNLRAVDRHAHAAVLAAGVALLAHAAIDWDWEMPVLFAWLFAAGGLACARRADPEGTEQGTAPRRVPRLLGGLACLLVAATPVLMVRSQGALEQAVRAFHAGDCATAIDRSLASLEALDMRPEPYELLGYCDLRAGANALGLRAMEAARRRDPNAWEYAYGVAVAQAIAGVGDPRGAADAAVRLNPSEPLARALRARLNRSRPAQWPRIAGRSEIPRG